MPVSLQLFARIKYSGALLPICKSVGYPTLGFFGDFDCSFDLGGGD